MSRATVLGFFSICNQTNYLIASYPKGIGICIPLNIVHLADLMITMACSSLKKNGYPGISILSNGRVKVYEDEKCFLLSLKELIEGVFNGLEMPEEPTRRFISRFFDYDGISIDSSEEEPVEMAVGFPI